MGNDETTAVFRVSEQEADDAAGQPGAAPR